MEKLVVGIILLIAFGFWHNHDVKVARDQCKQGIIFDPNLAGMGNGPYEAGFTGCNQDITFWNHW